MKTKPALFALLAFALLSFSSGTLRLRHTKWVSVKIPEPSDICLSPGKNSLYVVSDNGLLFETDMNGKVLRQSPFTGVDFEGVYSDANYVYVADETGRKVYMLDHANLARVRTCDVPYHGAANKGFEGITWNETKGVFVLVTEKDPTLIFELDKNFNKLNEVKFTKARDISSATWHGGFLWLLSDEDRCIFKLNPENYNVVETYKLNIINPEGIAFDSNGKLIIASDDLGRFYYFDKTLQ